MLNKVQLIGRLGADPVSKTLPGGTTVTELRLATTETWMKDGERKEKTEWHNVKCFDKLAETCAKYLAKGRLIYIEGSIETRSWDDKESGKKVYRTEIKAMGMKMLSPKPEGAAGPGPSAHDKAKADGYAPDAGQDDDVPF